MYISSYQLVYFCFRYDYIQSNGLPTVDLERFNNNDNSQLISHITIEEALHKDTPEIWIPPSIRTPTSVPSNHNTLNSLKGVCLQQTDSLGITLSFDSQCLPVNNIRNLLPEKSIYSCPKVGATCVGKKLTTEGSLPLTAQYGFILIYYVCIYVHRFIIDKQNLA